MTDRHVPAWDATYDVVVVGSGAGAMTAALRAFDQGLSVLIVEKSSVYGGTSAVSGGGIWIPCNDQIAGLGGNDSYDEAITYLRDVVGEDFDPQRIDAYLENGPRMVAWLAQHAQTHFHAVPRYPDYYPDRKGGKPGYRTMEPAAFDASRLGAHFDELRAPSPATLIGGRIAMTQIEAHTILTKQRGWLRLTARLMLRYATDFSWRRRTSRDRRLTLGNALIASLRAALAQRGIELWLDTPMHSLHTDGARVDGLMVERAGRPFGIRARRAVVLACGGFEANQAMREQYLPKPTRAEWSAAPPINTGDGIRAGLALGAGVALMDFVWGVPTVHVPGEEKQRGLFVERSAPRCVMVNGLGRRFVNESAPYPDVIHAMYADHAQTKANVPAWMIFDAEYRKRYPCGVLLPGSVQPDSKIPDGWLDTVIYRAPTLAELAAKIGVDADGLARTVAQMNGYAAAGVDPEFGKGGNVFDRYYGDSSSKPNPCLGPIERAPFYALRLDPGEIGTKGGLRTDAHARVLRPDESVIEGLYAIGNTSAAVMGKTYPGPGSTIGPAMTFGFVAANHIAAACAETETVGLQDTA
ncbi:3-oxosteroid 1-dehydrogenase [Paraburkholderia caffeinitolerans]|uniref:3-oxosteroid 1-dehydrogenase n=1 Tax=Paraburkholderia caffeinitolerans TaxID=1723730 RepID=A0A6J5FZ09_9BURK|nr:MULTISPECIES: FAD-dependent oxidoreductase [Paraburkholderia]CAB3787969.1 3-oxosteroid 1-dehydrogenase [Paraburkholderia caffeinitolerans]